MLLWFCDEDVVHRVAEGGQLAEDDEIEVQPDCITDENAILLWMVGS